MFKKFRKDFRSFLLILLLILRLQNVTKQIENVRVLKISVYRFVSGTNSSIPRSIPSSVDWRGTTPFPLAADFLRKFVSGKFVVRGLRNEFIETTFGEGNWAEERERGEPISFIKGEKRNRRGRRGNVRRARKVFPGWRRRFY